MLTNAHIGNSLSIHFVLKSQYTLSPSISADNFDLLRLQGLSRYGSHEYACKRLSGYKEGCRAIVATATSVQCPPSPVSPARQHRSSSRFCSTEPSFRSLHRLALPVAFSVNYSVSIPLRHTPSSLPSAHSTFRPHLTHPHTHISMFLYRAVFIIGFVSIAFVAQGTRAVLALLRRRRC